MVIFFFFFFLKKWSLLRQCSLNGIGERTSAAGMATVFPPLSPPLVGSMPNHQPSYAFTYGRVPTCLCKPHADMHHMWKTAIKSCTDVNRGMLNSRCQQRPSILHACRPYEIYEMRNRARLQRLLLVVCRVLESATRAGQH